MKNTFDLKILKFLYFSLSLFSPIVTHCSRRWSKMNFEVYEVISWLNKNLNMRIVWYFEKERRFDIKTSSAVRVLCAPENVHQKLVPGSFLVLENSPKQPMNARNSFENKLFWKRITKKLKKVNVVCYFAPSPFFMDKIMKERKGPGTSYQSLRVAKHF